MLNMSDLRTSSPVRSLSQGLTACKGLTAVKWIAFTDLALASIKCVSLVHFQTNKAIYRLNCLHRVALYYSII